MGKPLKTHLKSNLRVFQWAVTLSFLIFVFWKLDWRQTLTHLSAVSMPLVIVAVMPVAAAYWVIAAWRWQILLRAFGIFYPLKRAFELYLIGFFAGFALSDSVGAFVRGFYLKKDGFAVEKGLVTVFLDKISEILGLVAFSLFGLMVFSSAISSHWRIWLLFAVTLVTVVTAVWGIKGPFGTWLSRRVDRLLTTRFHFARERRVTRLHQELKSIPFSTWLQTAGITLLRRLSHYLSIYLLALALGIDISYITVAAVMSLVGLAVVMPIAVAGGLGVREGVLVSLFALLNQPKELAVSLALLIFFSTLLWRSIGMVYWMKNPLEKIPKADRGHE